MAKDVKGAGIAVFRSAGSRLGGLRVVEENPRLKTGAGVIHTFEDEVGPLEVLALQVIAREMDGVRRRPPAAPMIRQNGLRCGWRRCRAAHGMVTLVAYS